MKYRVKKIAKNIIFGLTPHIPFNRRLYLNNINKRAKLPFTSIYELTKPISFLSAFTYEKHLSNDFYGHASTLKKFCDLPDIYQFKFSMEHGVSVEKGVTKLDIDSPYSSIVTAGGERASFLKIYKKYPFAIGPFIYYASPLLTNKQIQNEKNRLGKNLLVFPSHSSIYVKTSFDIDNLCKNINNYAKGFDSVRICLYWKDVLEGVDKIYKKYGFEIVTAGHVLDNNFLSRLKSIILTSNSTLSNDVGSHIGYCIALGKPHYLMRQELNFTGMKSEVEVVKNGYQDMNVRKIIETFKKPSNVITANQLSFVTKHWGLDQIKSKKELLDIINQTEMYYHEKR